MKHKHLDLGPERQLVTALIVSDHYARQILPILDTSALSTPYARIVCSWVKEYWERYRAVPGKQIADVWQAKRGEILSEEEAQNVGEFLRTLSREYQRSSSLSNVPYLIDRSVHYLKLRSMSMLQQQLQIAEDGDDPTAGEQAIATYKRIEPPTGEVVSLSRDTQAIQRAFSEEEEVLFNLPGAVGTIAGPIHRGDFMGFMGPMKRGKTWWLWFVAETTMHKQFKAVFVTLEMTRNQVLRRGWQAIVGSPAHETSVTIPRFEPDPEHEQKFIIVAEEEQRQAIVIKSIPSLQKALRTRLRGGDVRVLALPAYSATVSDIEAHLDNLAFYDEYIPDVIVIDYADLIAPTYNRTEYRHQLDDIWKRLRKMAQERNAAVITASQTDRSTFDTDVTPAKVAEDVRKLAHVTSMVGLNQRPDEGQRGIMRLSQVAIREGRQIYEQAVVLQCLDIGRIHIDSKLRGEVSMKDDTKVQQTNRRKRR